MGMFLRRGKNWKASVVIGETGTTGLSKTQGYVVVDGVTYIAKTSLDLYIGSIVEIYVGSATNSNKPKCNVTLDGKIVQKGEGTYQYKVRKPSTIIISRKSVGSGSDVTYYRYCTITTT